MSDGTVKRASLDEIRKMRVAGELFHDPQAPEGSSEGDLLDRDFWDRATVEEPKGSPTRPVLLKLDPEVFEFFKSQGKGHVSRMQAVLKAYVKAHTPR